MSVEQPPSYPGPTPGLWESFKKNEREKSVLVDGYFNVRNLKFGNEEEVVVTLGHTVEDP